VKAFPDFPDLRTFIGRVSRAQFRKLPVRFVLYPVLDGPVLCFPPELEPSAQCWGAEISVLREQLARTRDRKRWLGMAHRVRVLHLRRVEAAYGYTWPGSLGRYAVEFSPDPPDA
jgi:hypothetical protein